LPKTGPGLTLLRSEKKGGNFLVTLPLSDEGLSALVKVCKQAPLGKGLSTVVDTSVRSSLELAPSKFFFANGTLWNEAIQDLADRVGEALGVKVCNCVKKKKKKN
jgi:hypothetical protein